MTLPYRSARLPWIVAALALLLAGAVLSWAFGRRAAAVDPGPALAAISARLDALEARVGHASPASATTAAAGGPLSRRAATAAAIPNLTPAQAQAERERIRQQLEASFRDDSADPVGGAQAERALEDVALSPTLAGTGIAPEDFSADCRRHLCVITASFAKSGDGEDWALFYGTAAAEAISSYQVVQLPRPDGSGELRIYAVRR